MGTNESKDDRSVEGDLVTVKQYTGNRKHGKRHGKGIYVYKNGDVYDGEWRKSKKYGKGVYTYSNGERYARRRVYIKLDYRNYLCFISDFYFPFLLFIAFYLLHGHKFV